MQKLLSFILISGFFWGCANPGIPTGGAIDTEPPMMEKESPENLTTDLYPQLIEVQFDEYVVLKDLQNQLLISPPIEPKPIIKAKNKTISIDMSECKLAENTTYVINFGNAIVDFTEGNPYKNYTYVFSTGGYIDSLSVKGSALDALTLKTEQGVSIQLYKNLSDTAIYTTKPDYVAKTDEQGKFELNFISPGTYRIYALVDGNKNYLLNKGEKIGYLSNPITLDSNLNNIELRYFETPEPVRVTSVQHVNKGVFTIGFNRGVNDEVKSIYLTDGPKGKRTINYSRFFDNDTAYFYTPTIQFNGRDSIDISIEFKDTTFIQRVNIVPELEVKLINIKVEENRIAPYDSLVFECHSPIRRIAEGKISIYDKTDSVQVTIFSLEQVFGDQFKFYIKSNWQEGHQYEVVFKDSIIVDEYGSYKGLNTSDTLLRQNVTIKKESETGVINITINFPKLDSTIWYLSNSISYPAIIGIQYYILQLVDQRDNVKRELYIDLSNKNIQQLKFTFDYLPPGEYRIKIISDVNVVDKQWTRGFFGNLKDNTSYYTQPEMVYYYNQILTVRANWELDEIVITVPSK